MIQLIAATQPLLLGGVLIWAAGVKLFGRLGGGAAGVPEIAGCQPDDGDRTRAPRQVPGCPCAQCLGDGFCSPYG